MCVRRALYEINWWWNENDGECACRFLNGVKDIRYDREKKPSDLLWSIDFLFFFGNYWTLEFEEWCQIVRANISSKPVEFMLARRRAVTFGSHIHRHVSYIYMFHATNVTNILIWKQSNVIFAMWLCLPLSRSLHAHMAKAPKYCMHSKSAVRVVQKNFMQDQARNL